MRIRDIVGLQFLHGKYSEFGVRIGREHQVDNNLSINTKNVLKILEEIITGNNSVHEKFYIVDDIYEKIIICLDDFSTPSSILNYISSNIDREDYVTIKKYIKRVNGFSHRFVGDSKGMDICTSGGDGKVAIFIDIDCVAIKEPTRRPNVHNVKKNIPDMVSSNLYCYEELNNTYPGNNNVSWSTINKFITNPSSRGALYQYQIDTLYNKYTLIIRIENIGSYNKTVLIIIDYLLSNELSLERYISHKI
jgi:hypothetical protein